jgi:hypothetical protein
MMIGDGSYAREDLNSGWSSATLFSLIFDHFHWQDIKSYHE